MSVTNPKTPDMTLTGPRSMVATVSTPKAMTLGQQAKQSQKPEPRKEGDK